MSYDLVIKNGTVIDGSGLPRYRADVGVRHGRITTIGRIRERAREVIDAEGQAVTPGFVDGHTHMPAAVPAVQRLSAGESPHRWRRGSPGFFSVIV